MKKTYIAPSMEAIAFKALNIIAGSAKPQVDPSQFTPTMDVQDREFFDDDEF